MSNITKTNKFGSFKKAALAVAITSTALTGCLDSGSSSSDNDTKTDVIKQVSISGSAVKGLLKNATVTAFTMSDVKLVETTTGEDGTYTLPQINHQGAVLIKLTTNADTHTVCDAAPGCGTKGGETIGFGDIYSFNDPNFILTSVLPSPSKSANQKLMVTPLTHLAAQRVIKQGLTNPNEIQGTVNATAKLLGLTGVDINTLAPVDITDPEAVKTATNEAKIYGALVGAIATMAEEDTSSSVAEVIKNITDDFAEDGGLKANSAEADTISLTTIFKKSGEVVAAAKNKAVENEVDIDLGAAEATLDREKISADNKPADVEVAPDDTPVVPGETTDADKLAALLQDVALWDDAIDNASDNAIYQPFDDQLDAAGTLADAMSEQSTLINTIEKLIAKEVVVEECYYYEQGTDQCLVSDTYTETANGPLLDGTQAITKSLVLVGFYERYVRLNGTTGITEYTLASAIQLGYVGSYDHKDNVEIVLNPVFDANNSMTSSGVVVTHLEEESVTNEIASEISYTVSRNEATSANKLTYTINQVGGHFGANAGGIDDIDFAGTGGTATITLADAAALDAFVGVTEGTDAGTLMNIKALDVSLNFEISTGAADGAADTEKASFDVTGNFTNGADNTANNADTAELSIEVNVNNTANNESAVGTITLNTEGKVTETVNTLDPTDLMHEYLAKTAGMTFDGKINLVGENNTSSSFDGKITMSATPLPADAKGRQVPDVTTMEFDGTVNIADADGYITNFTGNLKTTLEALKNTDGTAFYLGEELQAEATSMSLTGELSTQTSSGNASVNVEASVSFDYSDLILPSISLPKEGDEVGTVTFSLKEQAYTEVDGLSYLSAITLAVESSVPSYAESLNEQLPGLDAEVYGDASAEYRIEVKDCDFVSYSCVLYSNDNYVQSIDISSGISDNELLSVINSYSFQTHYLNYVFNPYAEIVTTFGEIGIGRNNSWYYYDDNSIKFANLNDNVTKPLIVQYEDYEIDYDVIETANHYRKVSASLKIDTKLAGIEDGHVTLTAENVAANDFKGSALFSYGPRVLKLDLDTREATNGNKSFVTIKNADISLKLVATCATETNAQGVQDTDIIAACEGDLDFSGDIYINGSDEKVAVIEDRDGLPVIKFVAGDSYGVVMVPNLDFVKQ